MTTTGACSGRWPNFFAAEESLCSRCGAVTVVLGEAARKTTEKRERNEPDATTAGDVRQTPPQTGRSDVEGADLLRVSSKKVDSLLLADLLQEWDVGILAACRQIMTPGNPVLIVDRLIADHPSRPAPVLLKTAKCCTELAASNAATAGTSNLTDGRCSHA